MFISKARKLIVKLFDKAWYIREYSDVAVAGVDPLTHYQRFGWKEGRQPHPLFHSAWYLQRYPDVAEANVDPLTHYMKNGYVEGRKPHPLFDTEWYLKEHPGVSASRLDPLTHYLEIGWRKGYNPNSIFDTKWYIEKYIAGSNMEPLGHYVQVGWKLGFWPSPLFHSDWYLGVNQDVKAANIDPLQHYIESGSVEGRRPCSLFDNTWYRSINKDVSDAGLEPLGHYLQHGSREGRPPNRVFDPEWYYREYRTQIDLCGYLPFDHFTRIGRFLGFYPSRHHRFAAEIGNFKENQAHIEYGVDDLSNICSKLIQDYIFKGRKFTIIFAGDNFMSVNKNGYLRRVHSTDKQISNFIRLYVRKKATSIERDYLDKIDEDVFQYTVNDFISGEVINKLALDCHLIMSNSIYPLEDPIFMQAFKSSKQKLLDFHGVVPEEVRLAGEMERSFHMDAIESVAICSATHLICVTDAMVRHYQNKYGDLGKPMYCIPIMVDIPEKYQSLKHGGGENITIYSGGLDPWQNIAFVRQLLNLNTGKSIIITPDIEASQRLISSDDELASEDIYYVTPKDDNDIWSLYARARYGIVVRNDCIVNKVACPTRLVEYCAAGIVPIFLSDDIGDFKEYGLRSINLYRFLEGDLPSDGEINHMRYHNNVIFYQLKEKFQREWCRLSEETHSMCG